MRSRYRYSVVQGLFNEDEFRAKVRATFNDFRKRTKGIARMNFACCGGCASYEIAMEPKNHGKASIFMHAQDQDGFEAGWLYVKFGWVRNSELEKTREVFADDKEVGELLRQIARKHGLVVVWDGTAERCVQLVPNVAVVEAYARQEDQLRTEHEAYNREKRYMAEVEQGPADSLVALGRVMEAM